MVQHMDYLNLPLNSTMIVFPPHQHSSIIIILSNVNLIIKLVLIFKELVIIFIMATPTCVICIISQTFSTMLHVAVTDRKRTLGPIPWIFVISSLRAWAIMV